MNHLRLPLLATGLITLWQLVVLVTGVPPYILPGPLPVARALVTHLPVLAPHLAITVIEILLGLLIGGLLGSIAALTMILSPLLVLWLGYGMASKVAMAVLIIFFPVTASFHDGMQRTDRDLLDLARIMGASPTGVLRHIVIPSALPAFAAGMRVAAAVAPIGAVIGEWVGSSEGLGFYMLHANARMQVDLMFAALTLLAAASLTLYFCIDRLLDRLVYWQPKHGTAP